MTEFYADADESWTGRAFLVHLSLEACPSSGRFCGRIQHVRSCDAVHFESIEELARFICLHAAEAARAGDVESGK